MSKFRRLLRGSIRVAKRAILAGLKGAVRLPVAVRFVVGILSCIGGLFWFLPVLGIWMLPLGFAIIGLCIPGLNKRILRWMDKLESELKSESSTTESNSEDDEPQSTSVGSGRR